MRWSEHRLTCERQVTMADRVRLMRVFWEQLVSLRPVGIWMEGCFSGVHLIVVVGHVLIACAQLLESLGHAAAFSKNMLPAQSALKSAPQCACSRRSLSWRCRYLNR